MFPPKLLIGFSAPVHCLTLLITIIKYLYTDLLTNIPFVVHCGFFLEQTRVGRFSPIIWTALEVSFLIVKHDNFAIIMQLSMLSPTPPSTGIVGIWWGFDLVGNQIPHGGDDSQNLIPTN